MKIRVLLIAFTIIIFATLSVIVIKRDTLPPTEVTQNNGRISFYASSEESTDMMLREKDVLAKSDVGYEFAIDRHWDVKIIQADETHFLLLAHKDNSNTIIEIEAFSHLFPTQNTLLDNPLIKTTQSASRNINDKDITIEEGHENFGDSSAESISGIWDKNDDKKLLIRVTGDDKTDIEATLNQIAESVSTGTKEQQQANSNGLVEPVKARETVSQEDILQIEYKAIEIMDEPLEDTLSENDTPYKDGYAKAYKFVALKSQRLALYAIEDFGPKSYIRSQLFDSNGNEISQEMGTHIEFSPTETGEYFLLVWTFDHQEGPVNVRIDDHDQIECYGVIKYNNGTEHLIDPEVYNSLVVGEEEVGYIYQCPRPIEIISEDTLQYKRVERATFEEETLETKKVDIWGCSTQECLDIQREGVNSFAVAESDGQEIEFSLTQISSNRVLITPKSGLFEKNYQYKLGGVGRFFTLAKLVPPDLQIFKDIEESYTGIRPLNNYDRPTVTAEYFYWIDSNGTEMDILGGKMLLRDLSVKHEESLEEFTQYLVAKGYIISDENNSEGPAPNNPYKKKTVVGLISNQTVCKIIHQDTSMLSIYCGTLEN